MGSHEVENLIQSIEAIENKYFFRKLWVGIVFLITFGVYVGNWQLWRSDITKDVETLKSQAASKVLDTAQCYFCKQP